MKDIDPKLLRAFLSVAKARSFTAAARMLGCSQGTASVRIRALEEKLELRLLDRGGNGSTLTPAGRELLPDAQALVDMHDRLIESATSGSLAGPIRLGVAQIYGVSLLSSFLKPIVDRYPAIEFSIECRQSWQLEQNILARHLDLAIVTLFEESPSAPVLCRPRLHWAAAPGFELDPNAPVPFAGCREPCLIRAAALGALEQHGVAIRNALHTDDQQAVVGAVAAGAALTAMVEGAIPPGLQIIDGASGLPDLGRTRIQMLERPGLTSEAAQLVKREIASHCRNIAAQTRTAGERHPALSG